MPRFDARLPQPEQLVGTAVGFLKRYSVCKFSVVERGMWLGHQHVLVSFVCASMCDADDLLSLPPDLNNWLFWLFGRLL
jgi:hypothetical protein